MSDSKQTDCQTVQLIEREYINSMLGIDQLDSSPAVIQHQSIKHKDAYIKPAIECSVFSIAGLNIAVASSSIREIIEQAILTNDDNNSQSSVSAGSFDHANESIDVIDIEYLVMNNNRDGKQKSTGVVLLKGCSTGFIYDQQLTSQTILSEQVHWRDANSQRIWLAGTVAELGLALLDIEGLLELLQAQH